jgi:hypothetical protein
MIKYKVYKVYFLIKHKNGINHRIFKIHIPTFILSNSKYTKDFRWIVRKFVDLCKGGYEQVAAPLLRFSDGGIGI